MYNAIFCRDCYLLLPGEFPTWEAFRAHLASCDLPAEFDMIPLLENNRVRRGAALCGQCMAPVFLCDVPANPVPFRIDEAEEVYPVHVERLTTAEYNARLRQVILAHCPGCSSYGALTDSDESLSGHHREISLNGVCFYRWEGPTPPASFRESLLEISDAFGARWLSEEGPEAVTQFLSTLLDSRMTAQRRRITPDSAVEMTLCWRSRDPLTPLLANAICHRVRRVTDDAVRLIPWQDPTPDEMHFPPPDLRHGPGGLRRSCAKYGVALSDLQWDGLDDGRVAASLARMEDQLLLHVLSIRKGRALLLMTEPATALKELRFRAPMLEKHSATLICHDEHGSRRYTISFNMPAQAII